MPSVARARSGLGGDFAVGVLVTIALCLVAFLCSGGIDLAPNTWVQVGLVVLAAAAAVAVLLKGARGPAWGAVAVGLFAALAGLTYASIAWSVQPATSWLEANRTLSYLAAFAVGLGAARLAPERWRALVGGVGAAAAVVCGYALLVKVFPGSLDANDPLGRLRAPFDYWNAVGLTAAMGLPACLWAGARREAAPTLRALSVPAIAVLVGALMLSYSRGALVVAVIGVAIWFALAPLRLRSALILALGIAAGAAIAAWGLATRGISADRVDLATRTSAGHSFGIVILVVLCLATLAGFAAAFALDRYALPPRLSRAVAVGLVGVVALIPVAGVAALAGSSRGLTGEVSHIWSELTNPNSVVGDTPGRLVQLSNSRPHYWSVGLKIGEHHLLAGTGALGYATASTRYPGGGVWDSVHNHVQHAHGYLFETFADFGLIGVVLSLGLLVAWALAAARTFELPWRVLGARSSPPSEPATGDVAAERTGLVALLAIVVTFGIHSLIDWTWFIPGTAVPALACAGWLAGRGPVSSPVGRLQTARWPHRSLSAAAALTALVLVTLLAAWVIVQPLRSYDAYSSAITAAVQGQGATALTQARRAADENPVSIDPLFLLSQLYSDLGNRATARTELTDAVSRQPANPQTWQQLGCFDLAQKRTALAARELRQVLVLDPSQTQIQTDPAGFCAAPGT